MLFIFFMLISLPQTGFAVKKEDMSQYQGRLKILQHSIAKIQQYLKGNRKKRSSVVTELQQLEQKISINTEKINILSKNITTIKQRQKKLEGEKKQLDKQLLSQKTLLIEQIRTAYSMGQQQQLKMLLNQQNPAEAGRTLVYFSYLNRAREQQIQHFLQTIEQKKQTTLQLQQTLSALKTALNAQQKRKKLRQRQRLQRKKLVRRLNHRIQNQESTLSDLESSRSRIENLLQSLGELLADIPAGPSAEKPFKDQKGHLPWPVNGPLLARFGEPKHRGGLKWNGVVIAANYGTPVRVISHGRIAFADWLQGFGFITIVDHGDGYMSLYGQSESLLKQVGDWVQAGEIIAMAGDSGGQSYSGVYFAIRFHGKPVNPKLWCISRH